MSRYKDLTGEKFGMLTVMNSAGKNKWGNKLWECLCECGNTVECATGNLTGKTPTKSCGCLKHRPSWNRKNLIGKKFGRLKVISLCKKKNNTLLVYNCICDCGTELRIKGAFLMSGNTKSCGCLRKDLLTTHGLTGHPLESTRKDMIARCYNPNRESYKWYGARGISVCKEWRDSLSIFYDWSIAHGWKKGLTLDRIDNDGNYTPENCQFIPNKKNARKTRLISKKNTSGYRGVSYCKKLKLFQAYYTNNLKMTHLGYFETAKTAAIVRDMAVLDLDLPLNFEHLKEI